MYKVIVAEDEAAAADHICALIERYCPGFQVVGRAANGVDALPLLRQRGADLVITDIKMPVMDGLALTKAIRREFPDTFTLIVSGYQEFEYAREALQNDVFDYLLKPLSPATLRKSLERVEERLRGQYNARRAELMRGFAREGPADTALLERYFPEPSYYAALVRKNGLPRRFATGAPIEIFSDSGELLSIYGRDEMESLCLCPSGPLDLASFESIMGRILGDTADGYRTLVLYPRAFPPRQAPEVVRSLYETLHMNAAVGVSRTVRVSKTASSGGEIPVEEHLQLLEVQLQRGAAGALRDTFCKCIGDWCAAQYPQLMMEWAVKRVLQQLGAGGRLEFEDHMDLLVEDAFFTATTASELSDNLWDILSKALPRQQDAGVKIDTPEFFGRIREYVEAHLSEPLMLQSLCVTFGVCQSYLSKLFRKHTDHSFNEYLTAMRMERAKQLLRQNPDMLVREAAVLVGYNDQFYFSRLFRSVTGMSPSEYADAAAQEL